MGIENTLIRKKKLNDVICDGDEQEKRSVVYTRTFNRTRCTVIMNVLRITACHVHVYNSGSKTCMLDLFSF